jgi:hypothetical protein
MIENGYVQLKAKTEVGQKSIDSYGAVRRVMRSRHQIGQMMRSDWRLYGIRGPFMEVCSTQGKWHQEFISQTEDPDFEIEKVWGQSHQY